MYLGQICQKESSDVTNLDSLDSAIESKEEEALMTASKEADEARMESLKTEIKQRVGFVTKG